MEVSFDVEALPDMSYRELQNLAKSLGIRANQKKDKLVAQIRKAASPSDQKPDNKKRKREENEVKEEDEGEEAQEEKKEKEVKKEEEDEEEETKEVQSKRAAKRSKPEDVKEEKSAVASLLARIEACLPDLKATLQPVTDEQIREAETKFGFSFPAELVTMLKWSNGTPNAPNMTEFCQYSRLEEIVEEFFYNDVFPAMFRQLKWVPIVQIDYDFCYNALDCATGLVVQIDNECQAYRVLAKSFVGNLQAYVEALEKHKDDLPALSKVKAQECGTLKRVAPKLFARFMALNQCGGDDY